MIERVVVQLELLGGDATLDDHGTMGRGHSHSVSRGQADPWVDEPVFAEWRIRGDAEVTRLRDEDSTADLWLRVHLDGLPDRCSGSPR